MNDTEEQILDWIEKRNQSEKNIDYATEQIKNHKTAIFNLENRKAEYKRELEEAETMLTHLIGKLK